MGRPHRRLSARERVKGSALPGTTRRLVWGPVIGFGLVSLAQGLRLVFGPWADRTRRYWTFTLAGYALTAV